MYVLKMNGFIKGFLDRVVITDLNNPDVNYYAICGKWLDKEKDDGLISRDLDLFTDLAEIRKGKQLIYTILCFMVHFFKG